MHAHPIVYLAAFVVLPVFWLLPMAGLMALVRFESRRGGPWWWLHLPLNGAFIAWCWYSVAVLQQDPHGPNSPFIAIPRLLLVAVFYLVVLPRLVDVIPRSVQRFRYAAAVVHLGAFAVLGRGFLQEIGVL